LILRNRQVEFDHGKLTGVTAGPRLARTLLATYDKLKFGIESNEDLRKVIHR
jgi:hypothetical protein